MLTKHDAKVISEWLSEEAAELAKARVEADQIDALFDAMGLILITMTACNRNVVYEGLRLFEESQERRNRKPWKIFDLLWTITRRVYHFGGEMTQTQRNLGLRSLIENRIENLKKRAANGEQ